MRFDKLLHPEIMLGKRGPKQLMDYYKDVVHDIRFNPTGTGGVEVNGLVQMLNASERRAITLMQRWRLDQGKVYHVAQEFLEALYAVERGLKLEYLPERFVGYISFAPGTIFDEEDEVEGAYVYVGPSKYTSLKTPDMDKVFWCAYICKGYGLIGSICVEMKQGETVEELLIKVEKDNETKSIFETYSPPGSVALSARSKVFNAVLNSVMYVHSQEPNIQKVPTADSMTCKKAVESHKKLGIKNACTLPIIFLNWNYAKQRNYSVDNTWVESFPRWQPCGVGFSQVKLIWVKEHQRQYKKETTDEKHHE